MELKLPAGAIGVYCAKDDCPRPSYDSKDNKDLLCNRHYISEVRDVLEEGEISDYIIPHDYNKFVMLQNSLLQYKKDKAIRDQIYQVLGIANSMGLALSRNDITILMGLDHTNPKYKKRVSDLKTDGLVEIVGYKKCPYTNRVVSLLARKDYIPNKYFGKSVLDNNVSMKSKGIVKCGTCRRPQLNKGEISDLAIEVLANGSNAGKKLVRALFPNF